MYFLKFPETLGTRLCGYLWAHIRRFGVLKIRFLAGRETLNSMVHGFLLEHL
jgi:hypothetical protein